MPRRKIRVGSRESKLAVIQSKIIMERIAQTHPEIELELVTIKTTGDKILDRPLDQIGGKGLFVKELDLALLEGRIDLSIHSLKDMPMEQMEEIPILAYSKREDPRDVLVLPQDAQEMDPAKPIGSSSPRRRLQLAELYPGKEVKSIRGNIQTRLAKLEKEYGALVLAWAGLYRLGLESRASRIFSTEEMIPAAGQGILAVQGRAGEDLSFLKEVDDLSARHSALAERAFVRALGGGCSEPVTAYAQQKGTSFLLTGMDGEGHKMTMEGSWEDPEALGFRLAERIRRKA